MRETLAQYEQSILVAFREVEDALVAVRTARDQRAAQSQQVEALRSALHLANLRYKGGLANYLDVLIAQRSLFDHVSNVLTSLEPEFPVSTIAFANRSLMGSNIL